MKTFVIPWMTAKGYNTETFAKESKIPYKTIQKWNNDESTPSLTQLMTISDILGVSLDDLVKRDPSFAENENPNAWVLDRGALQIIDFDLRKIMDERGVTPEELHEAIGVPVPIIERWMNKEVNPSLLQTAVLASTFGITIDELIFFNNDNAMAQANNAVPKEDDVNGHSFFMTTDQKEAVRLQNWLTKKEISNTVVVTDVNGRASFIVDYELPLPLTAVKIGSIVLNVMNGDYRERSSGKSRFDNMEVIFTKKKKRPEKTVNVTTTEDA